MNPTFAIIESVTPQVDSGRFPVKRVVGEEVEVTAACFAHGHELVACVVRHRGPGDEWRETPMEPLGNDLWRASFDVDRVGLWEYAVHCWVDHLTHWRDEFIRRVDPDDIRLAAKIGADLLADGRVYVGTTRYRGRVAFRPAIVNWRTTEADIDLIVEVVRELGARLGVAVA